MFLALGVFYLGALLEKIGKEYPQPCWHCSINSQSGSDNKTIPSHQSCRELKLFVSIERAKIVVARQD